MTSSDMHPEGVRRDFSTGPRGSVAPSPVMFVRFGDNAPALVFCGYQTRMIPLP
jgi:hypothetical protein